MKLITTLTKTIILPLLAFMMLFAFDSCARKEYFLTSTVTPAARGFVKLKKDKNNNYAIQIKLSDLAEVERLQPPARTYVIWEVGTDSTTKNIGQVKSSMGAFSKNLKGYFESVSATKPTKIFITAEQDGTVQYPNDQIILTTDNF
jgi:hypothetical protein